MKNILLILVLFFSASQIIVAQEKAIDLSLDFKGYNYFTDDLYPAFGVAYKNTVRSKYLIRVQFDYGSVKNPTPLTGGHNFLYGWPDDLPQDQQESYYLTSLWGYNFLHPESISRLYLSTGLGFRAYRMRYIDRMIFNESEYRSHERLDTTWSPLPFLPVELRYELIVDSRIGLNIYGGYRFALADENEALIESEYFDYFSTGFQRGEFSNALRDEVYFGFGLSFYFREVSETRASSGRRRPKGGYYEIWW